MTREEAERERDDAVADVREDGAPVLIRYQPAAVPPGGRERVPAAAVDVQTHAALTGFGQREVDGQTILAGDTKLILASKALGALANVVGDLPSGITPGPLGLTIYVPRAPATEVDYPTPGAEGVAAYQVVRLHETKHAGAYPVAHWLHVRG